MKKTIQRTYRKLLSTVSGRGGATDPRAKEANRSKNPSNLWMNRYAQQTQVRQAVVKRLGKEKRNAKGEYLMWDDLKMI